VFILKEMGKAGRWLKHFLPGLLSDICHGYGSRPNDVLAPQ
jgi:hypothetical protein